MVVSAQGVACETIARCEGEGIDDFHVVWLYFLRARVLKDKKKCFSQGVAS